MNEEKLKPDQPIEDKNLENPSVEGKSESKIEVIDLTDELMEQLSVVAQKRAASA
ncbi:MAG: hypothetical protein WBL50_05250 [Candidatus Acidiferrum sp.]